MYKKIILFILILISNSIQSQELKTSNELQGKWSNEEFGVEVKESSIVITNKKNAKAKDVLLTFLEIPKTNKPDEFESWSCTGIFNASVVKQGNIEVKEDMNEYIYFRLKLKKGKLYFEFSNSLYSNNFNPEHRLVPENIKKIYDEHGSLKNKMKLEK